MSLITSLQQNLGLSAPGPSQGSSTSANTPGVPLDLESGVGVYSHLFADWYTAKPYGFRMNRRDGKQYTMFMPISPSNLTITTSFATNVIPTIYGTVEEHSDIRYYDIVVEGTTGMAPKFVDPIDTSSGAGATTGNNKDSSAYASQQKSGRAKYPIKAAVLGGFFSSTIGQVTNLLNAANKAVSAVSNLFGGGNGQAEPETGLYTDQTGYLAFHNLYKFLKRYKQDASGLDNNGVPTSLTASKHPLTFFNYKDGNEYDVAVRSFVLRRSAENPMLYYYQIVMRGYNIRTVGSPIDAEDLNSRRKDLGLDGVGGSSLLSNIKDASNAAKSVVSSAVNGVNLFGR